MKLPSLSKAARVTPTIALAAFLATGPALVQAASPSSGAHQSTRLHTPNQCIRVNGGDYNACNVGNSGRGDRPYLTNGFQSPNDCIRVNGGDYNACNVGNSGRGDRPYLTNGFHSPNDCIRVNGGDYNACNVGNSGRGDRPYLASDAHTP